jgi:CheY-like chemotaxis protein
MNKNLMIVEDSGEVRKLLRITLGYGLYRIHEVDNAAEALVLARSVRPDVMLLDVMLSGGVSGFQLCEQVKRDPLLRSAFVVMVTARGSEADIAEGQRCGADAHVVKPFSPAHLIQVIESREQSGSQALAPTGMPSTG